MVAVAIAAVRLLSAGAAVTAVASLFVAAMITGW